MWRVGFGASHGGGHRVEGMVAFQTRRHSQTSLNEGGKEPAESRN